MEERELRERDRDRWLALLRDRMVALARRRVEPDDVEDVVQTAMGVIVERGPVAGETVDGAPALAWCFQVLRNSIGNHYKRRGTRRKHMVGDPEAGLEAAMAPEPAAEAEARLARLEEALADLGHRDEQCGRLLEATLDGRGAGDLARGLGLSAHALYQRLYRCRRRFRELLREKGILA